MEFEAGKTKPSSIWKHLMQQVAEQSDMCDVKIKLGSWEKRFHWCVLTASPFFDALYKGSFMERHSGVVKMEIGTPSTVEAALLFMYGKRPKLTDDNVGQLLQLAEFLLITNLKSHCFQWVNTRKVNSKNCIDICEMCSLYGFEIESCSQYVLAHLTELFNDDKMLKITNDTLTYILQDETLSYVSTEQLFDFIINWVAYSPGRQSYFEQMFKLLDPTGFSEEFLESRVLCIPLVNSSTTCMDKLANCQGSSTGDQLTDVLVPYPLKSTRSRDRVIECLDPIQPKWYQLLSQPGAVKGSKSASVYDYSTIFALNECENKLQIINIDKEMHVECMEKKLQYADNTVELPRINVKHVVVVADKCFLVSSCQRELIKSTTNKEHNIDEEVNDRTQLAELAKLRLLGYDHNFAVQSRVNQISNSRCDYVDTTTVYAQSGEDDENMYIRPLFTVKCDVHAVCSTTNGCICLLGDGQVSLFNTVTNIMDTIDTRSISLSEDEGRPTLSPTLDGFMVHSGPDAIQVTPIQGPALVDRWKLRKIRIDSSEEKMSIYSYYYLVNNTWYRNSQISFDEDYTFSAKADADLANFCQTQEWQPLPLPKRYKSRAMPTSLLHLRVPRRILRCHLECPHCEYKRSTFRPAAHDEYDDIYDDDDSDDDYYNDYISPEGYSSDNYYGSDSDEYQF